MDIPQEIRNIFSTPIGKTAARVLSHQHDSHAWEQGLERLRTQYYNQNDDVKS